MPIHIGGDGRGHWHGSAQGRRGNQMVSIVPPPHHTMPVNGVCDLDFWKLYVTNLPYRTSKSELAEYVSRQTGMAILAKHVFFHKPVYWKSVQNTAAFVSMEDVPNYTLAKGEDALLVLDRKPLVSYSGTSTFQTLRWKFATLPETTRRLQQQKKLTNPKTTRKQQTN